MSGDRIRNAAQLAQLATVSAGIAALAAQIAGLGGGDGADGPAAIIAIYRGNINMQLTTPQLIGKNPTAPAFRRWRPAAGYLLNISGTYDTSADIGIIAANETPAGSNVVFSNTTLGVADPGGSRALNTSISFNGHSMDSSFDAGLGLPTVQMSVAQSGPMTAQIVLFGYIID